MIPLHVVRKLDEAIVQGWLCRWEHPGFFEFTHPGHVHRVMVGEDEEGELLISAHEDDGADPAIASAAVKYEGELIPARLVEIVAGYLVTPPDRWEAES